MTRTAMQYQTEELVFAITTVDGSTRAARTRPDVEMASVLADYYALASDTLSSSQGRIVKVIGDGILLVFPIPLAREAVAALRRFQAAATTLWAEVDPGCRTQVKVGVGSLATGPFGPPGDERFDVYGSALNQLFKAPGADFVITPDLQGLLR
ncbi:MAG: adenylate/guanylate cyclase domain-containing protein [Candidatus Methylomirabilaceae bacterium]